MPTWLKVLLIVIVVFVALLVAVGFLGFRMMERVGNDNAKTYTDGAAFGRGKDANACIAESLTRSDGCAKNDAFCMMRAQTFLGACLHTASVPEDFCSGVPKFRVFPTSNPWVEAECARRGRAKDPRCQQVMMTVQMHCENGRR